VLEKPLAGRVRPYPTMLNGFNADAFWMQEHATRAVN
jgi:hypothetical protein